MHTELLEDQVAAGEVAEARECCQAILHICVVDMSFSLYLKQLCKESVRIVTCGGKGNTDAGWYQA